ncbi:hypothetical protein [Dysgonomonas sp. ZJ709]|uniref:hypothetical protein n=1 Tax=Dysgonomonas sp. ZJ709 TaxID=2709797 RepID=UPI0013EDEDA7|nr:hypothetical protein [Dysgonomonas sp. ZJ709]
MALENLSAKFRVDGVDFAPVITSEAALATAEWEPQPLTLRDDEVSIVEGDPEEQEIYSHENDAPEDYDIAGAGLTAVGSFIKSTYEQMLAHYGGKVSGTGDTAMFVRSSKKLVINKAVRFRFKNGGYAIIPNAKGYVLFNLNAGFDGVLKHPFSFKSLAQTGFDADIILKLQGDPVVQGIAAASAPEPAKASK